MTNEDPLFQLDESMRGAMATALVTWLGQEGRLETMVAQAFAYLMSPAKDRYGHTRDQLSYVETAFRAAAEQQLTRVAEQMLNENGEYQEKLRAALSEQVTALMENDTDFRQAIAQGLTNAIKKKDIY